MQVKLKKGTIETFFIFLLSPILSLPLVMLQLKRKDNLAGILVSFFVGLIAFLYIPSISNDKARYFERYELFKGMSFDNFLEFLTNLKKPDFIFDFILFLGSKSHIRIEFIFLLLTFVCVYVLFKIVNTIIKNSEPQSYNYLFVSFIILISFSLPGLLSGLRFTLGASIFIYGMFLLFFLQKNARGILVILLATQIHFSLLYFLPAIIIFGLDRLNKINYRMLFLASLIFLLIPSSITGTVLTSLSLSESLDAKTGVYVDEQDFVSQNFDTNQSSVLIYILRTAWYYATLIFLIFFGKRISKSGWGETIINLIYLFIFFTNFTYSFTTIFTRFAIIVKFSFLICLIYSYLNRQNKQLRKALYLLVTFFLISFLIDIYVLRYNFVQSLFSNYNLLLIQILDNKITHDEFLR